MFAGAAAFMQAVESQTLILYHTDLRGQWPEEAAGALAKRFRYLRRLALEGDSAAARASLAGAALALQALRRVSGLALRPADLEYRPGAKPRLVAELAAGAGCDFSIAHSGPHVACAAVKGTAVGLDLEFGTHPRLPEWVAREATVKAAGAGMRAVGEVELAPGGAQLRGRRWYARPLGHFEGASACLMTGAPLRAVAVESLTLTELFAS